MRTATVVKSRDGATGKKFSFRLEEIQLPEPDSFGEARSTCVVRQCDSPAAEYEVRVPKGEHQKFVWSAFHDVALAGDSVSEESVISQAAKKMAKPEGRDTRRQNAVRGLNGLIAADFLRRADDGQLRQV